MLRLPFCSACVFYCAQGAASSNTPFVLCWVRLDFLFSLRTTCREAKRIYKGRISLVDVVPTWSIVTVRMLLFLRLRQALASVWKMLEREYITYRHWSKERQRKYQGTNQGKACELVCPGQSHPSKKEGWPEVQQHILVEVLSHNGGGPKRYLLTSGSCILGDLTMLPLSREHPIIQSSEQPKWSSKPNHFWGPQLFMFVLSWLSVPMTKCCAWFLGHTYMAHMSPFWENSEFRLWQSMQSGVRSGAWERAMRQKVPTCANIG